MAADPIPEFDVVVIGGGPPGENVAQYATQGSDRTALIVEAALVGGECSYWACMPSKALLRPAAVLSAARSLPGVPVGERLDVAAVLARRDSFASVDAAAEHGHDETSQVEWARGIGIEVWKGHGTLVGDREVIVSGPGGERRVRARLAVVLATGTTATLPDLPGLRAALPWTSRDVTNVHQVPDSIVVMGGGVVACEAATWLTALGSKVTVVARGLLAAAEPFAGDMVAESLTAAGVQLRLGGRITAVQRDDPADTGVGRVHGGQVRVTVGDQTIEADELLVAAGRTPNSADLGLDAVGVRTDGRGFVGVDDHLTVAGTDWLYAIGDLNGRALLTHMGKHQARIAGAVIAARAAGLPLTSEHTDRSARAVPQVTFTEPEVASVGLTEAAAREAGLPVDTVEQDLAALAGTSLLRDGYRGRAKLVVDTEREVLLGATFVGPEVGELLHAATIAVVGEVPLDVLWHAVPSYPTASEIWLRLLEAWRGR